MKWEETNLHLELKDLEIVAEKFFSNDEINEEWMGYLVKANKYSSEIKIKE